MTIDHVVFDIGKVLIHYDPDLGLRDAIPDDDERAFFLSEVCTSAWNLEQDRGRSWEDAEAEAIARHPDRAAQIRAFRANWHRMVPYAYENSVALLRALIASGIDVTLLTNFAADTFTEARRRFPFLREGRGVTVSGEIGLIKPDIAIYERHAAAFDLEPSLTLFIDDSYANVEGARDAGWTALHFTTSEQLAADLSAIGLLP